MGATDQNAQAEAEARRRETVQRYRDSGESLTAFAREEGIARTTLSRWLDEAGADVAVSEIGRDDVAVVHPLNRGKHGARLRDVIGDKRAAQLAARGWIWAHDHGLRAWTDDALVKAYGKLKNPFKDLDRGEARATVCVEASAEQMELAARAQADRAAGLTGSARAAALSAASVKRVGAANERKAVESSKLEHWIGEHGQAAARLLAVRHELDIRHEVAIQNALQAPSERIVEQIGLRPEASAPDQARQKWDYLTGRMIRHEMEPLDPAEEAHVSERVRQYRQEAGMDPPDAAQAVEPPPPAVEIAA